MMVVVNISSGVQGLGEGGHLPLQPHILLSCRIRNSRMTWAVSGSSELSCDLEKRCTDRAKVTVSVQGSAMPQAGDGIIP